MSIDTYWSPVSPSVALSTSHRAFKGMSVSACIGDTCVDRIIISMGLNPDVFVPFQFLYFEIYSAPSVPECKHSGHSTEKMYVPLSSSTPQNRDVVATPVHHGM